MSSRWTVKDVCRGVPLVRAGLPGPTRGSHERVMYLRFRAMILTAMAVMFVSTYEWGPRPLHLRNALPSRISPRALVNMLIRRPPSARTK